MENKTDEKIREMALMELTRAKEIIGIDLEIWQLDDAIEIFDTLIKSRRYLSGIAGMCEEDG